MKYLDLIVSAVLTVAISPALADSPKPETAAVKPSKLNYSTDVSDDEVEHLPPASPKLIEQVLEEIPPNSVDRFLQIQTASNENPEDQDLAETSITLDRKGKDIKGVPKPVQLSICPLSGLHKSEHLKYYPLTRPGKDNFVAVVATAKNQASILNPIQGFNYGPIPFTPKMTSEQAESLWGKPVSEKRLGPNDIERTYKLVSKNQRNERREFVFECIFRTGRLFRYKIRSAGIDFVESGPMYYR